MNGKKIRLFLTITFFFLLISSSTALSSLSQSYAIIIDGDLSDWDIYDPILVDEEDNYWMDIQTAYMVNDNESIYFKVDYAKAFEYPSLFANVTLEIPNGSVFILLSAIYFANANHTSYSLIFHGTTIDNPYTEGTFHYVDYDNRTAIDNTTNKSMEFSFPMIDMGIQVNDKLKVVFWHYSNIIAGSNYSPKVQSLSVGNIYRRFPSEGYVSYTVNQSFTIFDQDNSSYSDPDNKETNIFLETSIVALITLGIIVKKKEKREI